MMNKRTMARPYRSGKGYAAYIRLINVAQSHLGVPCISKG